MTMIMGCGPIDGWPGALLVSPPRWDFAFVFPFRGNAMDDCCRLFLVCRFVLSICLSLWEPDDLLQPSRIVSGWFELEFAWLYMEDRTIGFRGSTADKRRTLIYPRSRTAEESWWVVWNERCCGLGQFINYPLRYPSGFQLEVFRFFFHFIQLFFFFSSFRPQIISVLLPLHNK